MGEEGFSGPSALLYHRDSPSAVVADRSRSTDRRAGVRAQPPGGARTTCAPPSVGRVRRADAVTGRRGLLGNDDVRLVVSRRRPRPARCTATRSATSWSTCSRAPPCSRACSGALAVGAGDYVVVPAGVDPPVGRRRDGPVRAAGRRVARPRASIPRRYLTRDRPVRRGGAVLRARRARPRRRAAARRRRPTSTVLVRTRAGLSRHVHARPPVRRRRLGRLRLPVGAVSIHDFEPIVGPHPPAAAGPPDVRRAGVRRVLVRAPALRLRPRRGEGPVPPRQRRLRRGAVLQRRRLHEPGRLGHRRRARSACTRPGSSTARSPGAASAATTATAHRRAGGDDRHVRPARSDRRRPARSATRPTPGPGRADRARRPTFRTGFGQPAAQNQYRN